MAPHLAHHASARRRFAREAQAAAVVHPHIIPIHNVESDGQLPYLVMQYVAGQSLQARVDSQGPLPVLDTLRIAQQTTSALSAAHAQGLVHRDVKPTKILLEDRVQRVLLNDFGLARAAMCDGNPVAFDKDTEGWPSAYKAAQHVACSYRAGAR